MRVLRAEGYRRMPWKNGGGETAEIAVFPENAALDAFDWRISMAAVASNGPFSAFPGVDRTLSILEGEGMMLEIESRDPVTLTTASAPLSFAADAATRARLVGGPVTDLNVMTRRGRYAHSVTRHEVDGTLGLSARPGEVMLFCAALRLRVVGEGFDAQLGLYDALMSTNLPAALQVDGSGRLFLIELNSLA